MSDLGSDTSNNICTDQNFRAKTYRFFRLVFAQVWYLLLFLIVLRILNGLSAMLPEQALAQRSIAIVPMALIFWYLIRFMLPFLVDTTQEISSLTSQRWNVLTFFKVLADEKGTMPTLLTTLFIGAVLSPLGAGLKLASTTTTVTAGSATFLGLMLYTFSQHSAAPAWLRNGYRWATQAKLPQIRQFLLGLAGVLPIIYIQGHLWFA